MSARLLARDKFTQRSMRRGVFTPMLAFALLVAFPPAGWAQDETALPDLLTIDQAVSQALANNRNLKIVALNLDSSKDKLLAAKTRRLTSFNIYAFGSQLL